jgi:trehalose-6-phosphate synthase
MRRSENHDKVFNIVTKYTSAHWGESFISELQRVCLEFDPVCGSVPVDVVEKPN